LGVAPVSDEEVYRKYSGDRVRFATGLVGPADAADVVADAIAAAPDVQTLDPAWSPDGRRIVYVRAEDASFVPPVGEGIDWTEKYRTRSLWIANADGSGAREIASAGRGIADPRFSPDGRSIVFVRDARVWALDLATAEVAALSGSLRSTAACTFDDCLPDVTPYEGVSVWSDHYTVKFAEPAR
jgi:dipeptidyl aminopeptidase/acylaminoacyl peptidase